MKEQTLKNHGKYVFLFHFVTYGAILAVIAASIVNLVRSSKDNLTQAIILVVISFILLSLGWFSRRFALKAQDRAIRSEENFRHFILTGKPMDKNLRLGQVIALRFASDEEFPSLCKQAVEKNLEGKEIKIAIQNWRADRHRA